MMIFDEISRRDGLRYLGLSGSNIAGTAAYGKNIGANDDIGCDQVGADKIAELISSCEKQISEAAMPGYVYKRFKASECPLPFEGQDIKEHLEGCEYVILTAATLGQEVDRLIRRTEVTDMARAFVLDGLASAASEQVCRTADLALHERTPGLYMTWRFSPGYGDFPLSVQRMLLSLLDAERRIGLCVSDSGILTPRKSITGVIGLTERKLPEERMNDIYFLPEAAIIIGTELAADPAAAAGTGSYIIGTEFAAGADRNRDSAAAGTGPNGIGTEFAAGAAQNRKAAAAEFNPNRKAAAAKSQPNCAAAPTTCGPRSAHRCSRCSMAENCRYRSKGEHCGF